MSKVKRLISNEIGTQGPNANETEPRIRTVFNSKCFTANYYAKDRKEALCQMIILIFCLTVMWWKGFWSFILLQWRSLLWLVSDACRGWLISDACYGCSVVASMPYTEQVNLLKMNWKFSQLSLHLENTSRRTSLVFQWLRSMLPVLRAGVWSLDPTCHKRTWSSQINKY